MPCIAPRGPESCHSLSSSCAMLSASGFSSMIEFSSGPALSSAAMRFQVPIDELLGREFAALHLIVQFGDWYFRVVGCRFQRVVSVHAAAMRQSVIRLSKRIILVS